ncbi:MAG: polysaccharide biosynthesis/export family protein [Planctomycetota bacterium]
MNSHPPFQRSGLMLLLLLLVASTGCYTRITTPRSTFEYRDASGNVTRSKHAKMVLAPDYNAVIRMRQADEQAEYRMQPGTRISVDVYAHDITKTVNIRPDGVVDLPLIGDVRAAGRTIPEFKGEISERYREFFVDPPQVIVNTEVTELGNLVQAGEVSIINPTGHQGVVTLTGDEMLSQVLAETATLHNKSQWTQIAVIRKARASQERFVIVSDVEQMLFAGDLDQDLRMRNGDIVFVPFARNTLIEEIVQTFGVLGNLFRDFQAVTDYIETVEGF